jgi:hypothetical protein
MILVTTTIDNNHNHNNYYVTAYVMVQQIAPRSVQICTTNCRTINILSPTSSSSLSLSMDDSINGLNGSNSNNSNNNNEMEKKQNESKDAIIARRIIVKGDVQGGYYRACVLNEVRYDKKSI